MQSPNSIDDNENYSDNSVDEFYDSRITFDSSREKSKNETDKSKLRLESGFHDKSSTNPSASHPTSSDPSEFFVPLNLEHVSVNSTNTAQSSLLSKNENVIINPSPSITECNATADEDIFPLGYEAIHMTHSNDFTPKSRNLSQYKSDGKRKVCQPTILEEESEVDENMLAKNISSLKIPSHFRSKAPFKLSNDDNFENLSPDINSLNTEIFKRDKLQHLPRESDIERINAAKFLTTSTPLIDFKKNVSFENFWDGISANAPSKIFALKTIIDELNYAKKRLLTAQKCYFDKQVINMNAGWNNLDEAIRDFQKQKNDEYAKIAEIRSNLADETKKKSTKEDAKRINELETEIQKLKNEDVKRTRQLSEWRVKFNNSEAALKAHKEESEKRLNQTIDLQTKLAKAQTEISNLRVKLNLAKEREKETKEKDLNTDKKSQHSSGQEGRTNASLLKRNSSASNTPKDYVPSYYNYVRDSARPRSSFSRRSVRWSSPLTTSQSFNSLNELPATFTFAGSSQRNIIAGMMNTKYEMTDRGNEYTFTNGPTSLICTELKCHCRLFEWNNGNFSWAFRMQRQRVEIDYFASSKSLEIWTPKENRFVLFPNKQFEIHWRNGDKTIITPDGKRLEVFWPTNKENSNEEDVQFEMHEDIGCVKWSITAQPEEFFPENKREGNRGQDTYTSILDSFSYSINCFDFKLRRLTADGYTKLLFPNISLQLNLCIVDSVFSIKHVVNCENNIKEKRDCYVFGSCNHVSRN